MQKIKPHSFKTITRADRVPGTYSTVNNAYLTDPSLGTAAKGLLTFLLSKPDNWKLKPELLANELKESESTIRNWINELKEKKYMFMVKIRNYNNQYNKEFRYFWSDSKEALKKRAIRVIAFMSSFFLICRSLKQELLNVENETYKQNDLNQNNINKKNKQAIKKEDQQPKKSLRQKVKECLSGKKKKKIGEGLEGNRKLIFELLKDQGIKAQAAATMAETYELDYIKEKLEYYEAESKKRLIPNPAGFIIKAIKDDYKPKQTGNQEPGKKQVPELPARKITSEPGTESFYNFFVQKKVIAGSQLLSDKDYEISNFLLQRFKGLKNMTIQAQEIRDPELKKETIQSIKQEKNFFLNDLTKIKALIDLKYLENMLTKFIGGLFPGYIRKYANQENLNEFMVIMGKL